jgi:hypothetical protein
VIPDISYRQMSSLSALLHEQSGPIGGDSSVVSALLGNAMLTPRNKTAITSPYTPEQVHRQGLRRAADAWSRFECIPIPSQPRHGPLTTPQHASPQPGHAPNPIPMQAGQARDSLAISLYASAFDAVVGLINRALRPEADAADPGLIESQDRLATRQGVALLDVFGFENLAVNSLEQVERVVERAGEGIQVE